MLALHLMRTCLFQQLQRHMMMQYEALALIFTSIRTYWVLVFIERNHPINLALGESGSTASIGRDLHVR